MTDAPYPTPHLIRAAKATLCDAGMIASLTRDQRADLVAVAFGILRDARDARRAQPHRPRIVVTPRRPGPGDAA